MKSKKTALRYTIIVIFLTAYSVIASANLLQSHAEISSAVKNFVIQQQIPLKNVQVTMTSLNKQLQVPKCGKPLQISQAPGAKLIGHISLSVRCVSPIDWKIHVAAHIDGKVNVLIARHPLPRGTMIQNSDLEFIQKKYSQLSHGYYSSANLLKNMEARRNIRTGQVLTPNLVKAQKLVLRGQHITIVARSGSLNLRTKGKALMDGQKGQTIKVSNLNSKKLIYARVVSAGIVEINF